MGDRHKKNKEDIKITFIAGTLGTGGAERQLFYLISSLKQAGYQVSLICLTQNEFWESKIIALGVKVEFAGFSKNRLIRLNQIYKFIKCIKPDLIYSFHFYTNIYAGIVGMLCRIKTFGSIRSDGSSEKRANGYLSWAHYFLPDVIIANSEHGLRNCKKIFYAKKSGVLNNVIDIGKFQFSQKTIQEPMKFVFIGRFEDQKRPFLFLQLMDKLVQLGLKCEGKMYGDGSLKESVISTLNSEYMDLPVQIFDSHKNVEEVYENADCLVIVSRYEGTPNVVLEAMSAGLVVAAMDFEGITNILEPGVSGLISNKIENLAEEIIFAVRNEQITYLSQNARLNIVNNFDLSNQIFHFERLLNKDFLN